MPRQLKVKPALALRLYKKLRTVKLVQAALAKQGIKAASSSIWRSIQSTPEGAALMAQNSKHRKQSSAHLRRIGVADIHKYG